MIIFKSAGQLTNYLEEQRKTGVTIGFVPTMGALHMGHLSLIDQSTQNNSLTVCSIFVNPTQFNNKEDFKLYPISIEKDLEQLIKAGCNLLFLPTEEDVYPRNYKPKHYELGKLETILEGHYRPGHFQGVCQVVDRLLAIINPNNIYIGQKDYQQCMVIKRLIESLGKNGKIRINLAPTIREMDGLAMSSRNLRLTKEQRNTALAIYKVMTAIKDQLNEESLEQLKRDAILHLEEAGFAVDYVEIANADSLEPASSKDDQLVVLIAATLGNIRLIDNISLN